tara:strand:+ start:63 stop:1367 length:1305 start_codon:yes stop_codon:yes gene_type:complete
MNFTKNIILLFFIYNCIAVSQETNYLDFEIIVEDNPYPSNIFIHNLSHVAPITGTMPRYMAIIDSTLNPAWVVHSGDLGLDFKAHVNKLSYFDYENKAWILLNEYMCEMDTLKCTNEYFTDFHDIIILQNGGYILQAFDTISVDLSTFAPNGNTSAMVVDLIIQEFDSAKNLIFEWSAWEHLDFASYNYFDFSVNFIPWMHGNSIDIDLDSNIIISNRRSSEIIKFNRDNGQIIWIMGGPNNQFTIMNDQYNGFNRQHDVRRLENGNLLLFDNGNDHEPPISRAVEYELDENNMIANLVWEFSHPNNYLGLAMGSVQRLPNNNTLINWGRLEEQIGVITEVDYNNNIVLEIKFTNPVFFYRARKHEWQFDTNLIMGDTNLDGQINIIDLTNICDYSFQEIANLDIFHLYRFDINRDRTVDYNDIEILANKITGL